MVPTVPLNTFLKARSRRSVPNVDLLMKTQSDDFDILFLGPYGVHIDQRSGKLDLRSFFP